MREYGKNKVQPERLPMTIRRMRVERWIPNATDAHSEYAIPIDFQLQQWFMNASQCYVLRTLPVLLFSSFIMFI